jgi:hypothetical protein
MCRFLQKEISQISQITIIQDNNGIHINPKPRYKYVEILEISEKFQKFQGNFINMWKFQKFQGNFRDFNYTR